MKINDYESVSLLKDEDNFVVETTGGTRKVSASLVRNSGSVGEEITLEEYEALTEEEKLNGTYWITDAEATNPEALKNLDDRVEVLESNAPHEIITNENGTAYKFASGLLICVNYVVSVVSFSGWGTWYESTGIPLGDFAYPFIAKPNVSAISLDSDLSCINGNVAGVTNTSAGSTKVFRPTNAAASTVRISYTAIGKWK